MTKNKFSSYLLLISIFSFVAVFTLIVQTSYQNMLNIQDTAIDKEFTAAFNPNLDKTVIEIIKSKEYISPEMAPNYEPKAGYSLDLNTTTTVSTPSASTTSSAVKP